jgi:glycosyltransferase involved in cell wall biosynthesis
MVRLGLAQRERGFEVYLACPTAPHPGHRAVAGEAEKAGLPPEFAIPPGRGLRPLADRLDGRALRVLLEHHEIDVVHTWHTRDHLLALRAMGARRRRGATALVRSYRKAEAIPRLPWNRWLFGPGADGLLCVSPETADRNRAIRGGRPVRGAFGAVDTERFVPRPAAPQVRAALGLSPEHRVVGIVARIQRHRRFDLLLEAAAGLLRADPRTRLLVVGRGTHRQAVAEEPARRMGLADRMIFAGYRTEDYTEVLRAIDVFTFLVPGSDGTCRALLEAAACGIPAVTSKRGALPEIVIDGDTGVLCEENPEALASAWRALLDDPVRRRAMGENARKRAEIVFTPSRFAEEVAALYAEARRSSAPARHHEAVES